MRHTFAFGSALLTLLPLQAFATSQDLGPLRHNARATGQAQALETENSGTPYLEFSDSDSRIDSDPVSVSAHSDGYGFDASAWSQAGQLGAAAYSERPAQVAHPASGASASGLAEVTERFVISGGSGTAHATLNATLNGSMGGRLPEGEAWVIFSARYLYPTSSECLYGPVICDESNYDQTLVYDDNFLTGARGITLNTLYSGQFLFTYDQPFEIKMSLTVGARDGGYADFFDAGRLLSLDLPAGATIRSASGITFSAPVPEADSYAMLLAGLGLIAWRCRRKV